METDTRSSSIIHSSDTGSRVTRTETEFNFNWAKENPELFVQNFQKFANEYPIDSWKHYLDLSRTGYVTIIANRREKSYDFDNDFLVEIGMK
jgi:hypothetical protein